MDDPDFWTKMLPEVPQLDASSAAAMDAAATAAASGADRLRTYLCRALRTVIWRPRVVQSMACGYPLYYGSTMVVLW